MFLASSTTRCCKRGACSPPTLVADAVSNTSLRFDIRLRGGEETPFFDD
jgi:hypothetical protein